MAMEVDSISIRMIVKVKTDEEAGFHDAEQAHRFADEYLKERGELGGFGGDWYFSCAWLKNHDVAWVEYDQ